MPAFWWPKWAGDPVMSAGFTCTISQGTCLLTPSKVWRMVVVVHNLMQRKQFILFYLFVSALTTTKG
jgi:hypothetical protein